MNPFHLLRSRADRSQPAGPRASVEVTAVPPAGISAFLRASRVAWLSTVDADGCPTVVPTWFWLRGSF